MLSVEGNYLILIRVFCKNGGFKRLKDLPKVSPEEMLRGVSVSLFGPCPVEMCF